MLGAIFGHRVALKPIYASDPVDLACWRHEEEFVRSIGAPPNHGANPRGASFRRGFLVCSRDLNSLLGYISLEHISWKKGSAELRAFMKYRGKGYGQDAITAVLDYVFSSTSLKQIYLKVSMKNARAIACYLKCGFKAEGILRAGRRSRDGLQDLYLMVVERPSTAAAHRPAVNLQLAPRYPRGFAVPAASTP